MSSPVLSDYYRCQLKAEYRARYEKTRARKQREKNAQANTALNFSVPPPPPLEGRVTIDYSPDKKNVNDVRKTIYLAEDQLLDPPFKEQTQYAQQISFEFMINSTVAFMMVIAPTQWGKTGTIREIFRCFVEQGVPAKHLFYITGKSDKDLLKQSQKRFPKTIRKRAFHNPGLQKHFVNAIRRKRDCVIVIDECHCAAGEENSVSKAFQLAGLLDLQELYRRNIRIILLSATPNGTIYDLQKWGKDTYKIIHISPRSNELYTGVLDLYGKNRVYEAKDLMQPENMAEFSEKLLEYDANGNDPLYHIIRCPKGDRFQIMKQHFMNYFGQNILLNYLDFLQSNTQTEENIDINQVLAVRPEKHTIIFIKEKLRCGKTLNKTYLGILYDRPSFTNMDDVTIQGLLGRATGYDDNGKTIIFCNIESIFRYIPMGENGDYTSDGVEWNSASTETRDGKVVGKQTFTDPAHYKGSGVSPKPHRKRESPQNTFHILFNSFASLQECYRLFHEKYNTIGQKSRGPKKSKTNAEGFVLGTIRKASQTVLSLDHVLSEKNNAVSRKKLCAYKPCYRNVNDPNTLLFVFIHRQADFTHASFLTI